MTKAETIKLAKLEQTVEDGFKELRSDIKEIKSLLQAQDQKFAKQQGKYITQAFAWKITGLIVSIVALGIAFANWIKNQ